MACVICLVILIFIKSDAEATDTITNLKNFLKRLKDALIFPLQAILVRAKIVKNEFPKFWDKITERVDYVEQLKLLKLTKYQRILEYNNNLKYSYILTPSEVLASHGFKTETHRIITTDGYVLTLYRILPENDDEIRNGSRVALLHHGLFGTSVDWLLLGPRKALPYLLMDAGYDVWLANARGNKYSRSHLRKNVDTREFWDFTFHEIGVYDLPAVIDYIVLKAKGDVLIDFIGHSMGSTAFCVFLSALPEYNLKLRSATLLAPLVFMYEIKGPLQYLAEFQTRNGLDSLHFLSETEFVPTKLFTHEMIKKFCTGVAELCLNSWLLIANGGREIPNEHLKKEILKYVPASVSTKTIEHYCQLVQHGKFRTFNFGVKNNFKRYGSTSPPMYNLSNIFVPVTVFSSEADWLSTVPSNKRLLAELPNLLHHYTIQNFSHVDFVWSMNANRLVYSRVLKVLNILSI